VMTVLGAISPFYAFQTADVTGRLIVLALFGMSIFAWTIAIEKWLHLRQLQREISHSLDYFHRVQSPVEMFLHLEALSGPVQAIARAVLDTMAKCQRKSADQYLGELRSRKPMPVLTPAEAEFVKAQMESAVDNEVLRMEARLPVLGTVVGAAPFLGLLGTVWGVMMAFCSMAILGKADINALAPGISGALLTTVVGLVVAIPAMLGYNHLVQRVKLLSIKLDNYAAELVTWLTHVQASPAGGTPRTPERP
jgi:biopolymer transport protein TolQ